MLDFKYSQIRKKLLFTNIENVDEPGPFLQFVRLTAPHHSAQWGLLRIEGPPASRRVRMNPCMGRPPSSLVRSQHIPSCCPSLCYSKVNVNCLPSSDIVDKQLQRTLAKAPWMGVILLRQAHAKPENSKPASQRASISLPPDICSLSAIMWYEKQRQSHPS